MQDAPLRRVQPLPALAGGLAGTVVFGLMMTMMGMMPMVAMLVRSEPIAVGWAVHLAIGASLGLVFAAWAAIVPLPAWLSGMAYGVVAWVGGALVAMPLLLGMPGMVLNLAAPTPWWSLVGHLMFGLVLGLVYGALARPQGSRTGASRQPASP